VIDNLNTVLASADEKGAQFDASVDQLQQVITGLAQSRDPIAGAIGPLASAENNLTDMLQQSRRPLQGVIENVRPLAQRMDERKADINKVIEPLAENYLRLNALGAYGAFFNIYYCSIRMKINGPAGSDILIPSAVRRICPRRGARRIARPDGANPLRTRIFGIVLVVCLVLVSFGYTRLPFWPQGRVYEAYFTDAGGISPGSDVNVSGIRVGRSTLSSWRATPPR
jgi:ABC-type transporter Mla subunit MlaD